MDRFAARVGVLIVALALSVPGIESQAASRRSCQRACKRFARQCAVAPSQPKRCERLLRRLDKCGERGVVCATTTTTSSTTSTTLAGSGSAVIVDGARATTQTVTPDGGTLTATAADGTVYSLVIPPDALLLETAITMTPIVSVAGEDFPAGPVLGVDLQPSGLRLYEFATLTIVPSQLGPTAAIAGFSYEGAGDDLHPYPAALHAGRIVLHVIHFSGAGAEVCVEHCFPPIIPPPAITEAQLEQLIAQLDPHHPFYASRLAELLHAYYDFFIAPDLPLMEQSCEFATSRIPKVLAWSRTNQLLLNEEGFEGKNQTVGDSLFRSASNCWSEVTAACLDPSNAYQVKNVLQIARQAQLLGGDPEIFDPGTVRRCSGLWSGTITYEWTLEEDASFPVGAAAFTRSTRLRNAQEWRIEPNVIGDPCEGCPFRMYAAAWVGTASVNNRYVKDYGNCTDTVTQLDHVDGTATPSAFSIGTVRGQTAFQVHRATPWMQGAPPYGVVDRPYVSTRVHCTGWVETVPFASLHVAENWTLWPFYELPLDRTDPTIPTTSKGQKVDRQERAVLGGTEVITTTWTWDLTLEPDAAE